MQGYHVARLAADLRDFLTALQLQVGLQLLQACQLRWNAAPVRVNAARVHA